MGVEEVQHVCLSVLEVEAIHLHMLRRPRYHTAQVHRQLPVHKQPCIIGAREVEELAGARLVRELKGDGVGEVPVMIIALVAEQHPVDRVEGVLHQLEHPLGVADQPDGLAA